MATAQKITDHFLTCTICHDVLSDPSTLACGHSSCGLCLVSFTKTRTDAVRSKSIPCPFCRRLTRVPDPSRPVEEWAGQMRPTLLLKGLLDTIGPGAKDTTNCNWCRDKRETNPAVSWCPVCDASLCSNCLKTHQRSPSTKHHDVSDMTEEVKVKRRTKVTCHEHKEELVKFFCRDCRRALCQSCCILYHRKCESVVSLESTLPEIRSALETRKETLIKTFRVEKGQLESLKSRCKDIDKTKSSVQFQIRSTTQRVIDAVKKKEKELLDKLTEITDKQIDQLKADIKSGDMASNIYRQQSELIEQALNSEDEMDMYDLYQSNESEAAESVGDVKKRRTRTRIKLSQDVDRLDSTLSELSLGNIQVSDEVDLETVSPPVLSQTVHCKTKEDPNTSMVVDIVSMEVEGTDTLIVIDGLNNCIKSLFGRNNQRHQSRLSVESCPSRISKLDDSKIGVTLPTSNQIAVVSVTPDLTLDSTITTQKKYSCLTALTPTTLAAAYHSSPCLDILDRSGNMMRSIRPLPNGENTLRSPSYLCTTRQGNILISDTAAYSVVCVTPQGEVVFNYSPTGDRTLWSPAGISSTATGHILVGDSDSEFRRVLVLKETGEFVRDLLTPHEGFGSPSCLDWDERGRIYVTHYSFLDGKLWTCVQIYEFK